MSRSMLPLLVLLLAPAVVLAQPASISLGGGPSERRVPAEVVTWSARAVPVQGRPGTFRLDISGSILEGWRVYGMNTTTVGRPLSVEVTSLPRGFEVVSAPVESARTYVGRDEVFDVDYPYFAGRAAVTAHIRAGRRAAPGRHLIRGNVRFAACDDRVCLPPRTVPFEAELTLAASR